jgi:hypothetical protein
VKEPHKEQLKPLAADKKGQNPSTKNQLGYIG